MMMETNRRQQVALTSEQKCLRERAKQLAAEFCAGNDHAFSI